ncbi:restriction endonuclease subunit S [Lacticaseibacillus paracasei]|uniref:restriction endonuclease subunit S n=1 Tax=Lacticaseibacillus paracasei TaxID=1597 RepID=UPI0036D2CFDF
MSKDAKNVPALRFKGYSDAWEKRKLGDLGSVAMNKRIYKDQTSDEGEIPFYKIGSFGKQADAFISRKLFNEYKKLYPFPKKGDILISASGSIGRTIVYNGEDAYFQDSNIIWIQHDNRLDNTFLHQLFNIIRWSGVEGTTIKRLYNKNILSTQILLPSVEEQRSIGNLLDNVDNLIAATQHKIDAFEQVKKALLQQLFDQSWRFKGYSDPWEKRKLGDIFYQVSFFVNPEDAKLELWSLTVAEGLTPKSIRYDRNFLVRKQDKFKVVHSEDFVYNPMNITLGALDQNKLLKSVAVSGYYTTMSINRGFDGSFFKFLLSSPLMIRKYKNYATGSLLEKQRVQFSTFSIINIKAPKFDEQNKIGNFLIKLDHLIAATQSRLSSLELLKKSLLQDLFI